jgi:major membrane immunogen (membrane-anchored lipoprotein)
MKEGSWKTKKNGLIGLAALIILGIVLILGSNPLYKALDNMARPAIYTPGVYEASAKGYGGPVKVVVTVSSKSIESIEVVAEKDTLLSQVYPVLTDSIMARQTTEVDAVSGATITSDAVKNAVDLALAQARGEAIEEETVPETEPAVTADWKDGTYKYEAPEFDDNGYKDLVSMTIENNTITALTWDCISKDGELKSQLSMDGKYVMTESNPKWHEQAEAVVAYVMEHQGLDGLINSEGYTDTVASVSINLYGFVNGVKDCLKQASEATATESALKDGTYKYEAPEFDDNGYKDLVSMTIESNTITALTWDCISKDGELKSQLSMDGKYVMTESNPKWHEQAEAVVAYVMEHQGLDGLINNDGYTDTVASVSINLYGFVNGVKDCLSQAAESTATESAWKDGTYKYEAPEFDQNGYKDLVSITIKDNEITALTWDCISKDGELKSQLSMDGKYVMTESNPKWHEQAEAVVAYVMEHQGLDGLINNDGYTDTVASVSINLYGFVNGVKDCLSQAVK